MTITEQLAQIKAAEAAEQDRAMTRHERDEAADVASICAGCGRKWSTVQALRPMHPKWIPEARGYWHLRCYQNFKEGR